MGKRFSASNAAQLIACHGSANLDLAIPGWKEPVRDPMAGAKGVGTNVHTVLEPFHALRPQQLDNRATLAFEYAKLHHLKRKLIADDGAEAHLWVGQLTLLQQPKSLDPDKVEWLRSLREFAPAMLRFIGATALYMADLLETVDHSNTVVKAEENLIANWLPSKSGTTPDVTIVARDRLEVVDYKSGKIPVDPVDNDQLMFYAACKLHEAPDATEFTVHILQPGNLESWTAPIEHLHKWMALAIEADNAIIAKDLTLVPNDHCTFCPANPHSRGDKGRPFCPAMMQKLYPQVVDEDAIFNA